MRGFRACLFPLARSLANPEIPSFSPLGDCAGSKIRERCEPMFSVRYRESMWRRRLLTAAGLDDHTVLRRSSLPSLTLTYTNHGSFMPGEHRGTPTFCDVTVPLHVRPAWDVATHPPVSHTLLGRNVGRIRVLFTSGNAY